MNKTLLLSLLPLAVLSRVTCAQQLTEGLAATTHTLAPTTGVVLQTTNGLVAFDGSALTLTPSGQPPQTLLQTPAFTFGSFLVEVGGTHVLFGHGGSSDVVWLVPLAGPQPAQRLANVALNYDAALLTATTAIVSARLGGFSATDNNLVVLDLQNGALQTVAAIPGASGPVTIAANGDVYFATSSPAFPTPPGLAQILRFRRPVLDNAIANSIVLTPAQAEIVQSGLDSAGDLAFDDDGDLMFVDWFNATIGELNDAGSAAPWLGAPLITYTSAPASASTVQFLPASGLGVFEPFQPANAELLVLETDFFSLARTRTIRTAPANLTATGTSPQPIGPFDLVTTGAPSLGIGLLAFAPSTSPGTSVLSIPGFEQPLHWSNALTAPVLLPIVFDAAGGASLTIVNPGFAPPLAATVQVLHFSTTGVLGATAPLQLAIGQ